MWPQLRFLLPRVTLGGGHGLHSGPQFPPPYKGLGLHLLDHVVGPATLAEGRGTAVVCAAHCPNAGPTSGPSPSWPVLAYGTCCVREESI